MRLLIIAIFSLICAKPILAQIITGTDTLYGNEWFKENQAYWVAYIGVDGVYRIATSVLKGC